MKTVLFLDFDNVVNIEMSRTAYNKRKDVFGYLRKNHAAGYRIEYSAELVRKLNSAKNEYGFEWLWLSTWLDNTSTLDVVMGSRSDGYVDWDAFGGLLALSDDERVAVRDARKYEKVLDSVRNNPRPFVWVDDSATTRYNPADFTGDMDVPRLVLTPDPKPGITKPDFDKMLTFFDENRG